MNKYRVEQKGNYFYPQYNSWKTLWIWSKIYVSISDQPYPEKYYNPGVTRFKTFEEAEYFCKKHKERIINLVI